MKWSTLRLTMGSALLLAGGFTQCGSGHGSNVAPVPVKDGRVLSMYIFPRTVPPATQSDLQAAMTLAYNAGVRGAIAAWTWKELEPSAGQYTLQDAANQLNDFGNTRGLDLQVTVNVIDTVSRQMPSDLEGLSFSAPQVKQRFHALLDALRPHLNSHVRYFVIGNEVGSYLAAHPAEWSAYQDFYQDGATYLRSIVPGVKVSVCVEFSGLMGPDASKITELNASSDVYTLTYYPTDGQFNVQGPASPLADFPRMLAGTGGKPVVLKEVGYPTSSVLGSSEAQQAEFIANVFAAWKVAGSRIPFMSYFALHDFNQQLCTDLLGYYGAPDTAVKMREFLCSLGLRKADGTPKTGWQAFATGAAANGFPQ